MKGVYYMQKTNYFIELQKGANYHSAYEKNGTQLRSKKKRRLKYYRRKLWLRLIFLISCMCISGWVVVVAWLTFFQSDWKSVSGEDIVSYSIIENEELQNKDINSEIESYTDTIWNLILVNYENLIPENYKVELVNVPGGEQVDKRIYKPLMEMLQDATAEELDPIVVSGYRTQEKQQSLYDKKIREYQHQGYSKNEAVELAQKWVANPGTSEHQLGLAVDINGATYDLYLWLQENSYKYGFIFRYPGNKTNITGVAEEVWHYRYVGKEAAMEIYERGICLEEYLEDLK